MVGRLVSRADVAAVCVMNSSALTEDLCDCAVTKKAERLRLWVFQGGMRIRAF